jgi:hypothetical protein
VTLREHRTPSPHARLARTGPAGNLCAMKTFRVLFGIDALAAALVVFFFLWGVSDGTVSSFNILLWLMMLAGVGGVLGGGLWLRSIGQPRLAIGVLLILAIPTALFAFFVLSLIVLQPRWN